MEEKAVERLKFLENCFHSLFVTDRKEGREEEPAPGKLNEEEATAEYRNN